MGCLIFCFVVDACVGCFRFEADVVPVCMSEDPQSLFAIRIANHTRARRVLGGPKGDLSELPDGSMDGSLSWVV